MLLALDTATTTASVALYDLDNHQLLAELTWLAHRRQTQDLLPTLQNVLQSIDATPQAITCLAVSTGPGSFTGVRIAISTAKGLALGLPQPPAVVGIPTLSVTAVPFIELAAAASRTAVCATIQAGRGRYNWAWFTSHDLLHRPTAEEHYAGNVDEFAAFLSDCSGRVWLAGEIGLDLQGRVAQLEHVHCVDHVTGLRRAGQLARLAAAHVAAGRRDAIETLQPLYLRNP
jgi:tRNA threonylcarbamoyladenosine biosynthesis protein TsaB